MIRDCSPDRFSWLRTVFQQSDALFLRALKFLVEVEEIAVETRAFFGWGRFGPHGLLVESCPDAMSGTVCVRIAAAVANFHHHVESIVNAEMSLLRKIQDA